MNTVVHTLEKRPIKLAIIVTCAAALVLLAAAAVMFLNNGEAEKKEAVASAGLAPAAVSVVVAPVVQKTVPSTRN
jgi:flagellar basal body-associated protein FliL